MASVAWYHSKDTSNNLVSVVKRILTKVMKEKIGVHEIYFCNQKNLKVWRLLTIIQWDRKQNKIEVIEIGR